MHTGQTTHERARAHANMFAGCCYDPILLTFSFIGMSDVFAVASACCMTSTCAHAKRIMFGCPWPPANAVRCVGEIKWYTKLLLFALHSFIFVFLRLPVFFLNLCSMSLKRRLHRHFFIRSICSSLYIYIYIYMLSLSVQFRFGICQTIHSALSIVPCCFCYFFLLFPFRTWAAKLNKNNGTGHVTFAPPVQLLLMLQQNTHRKKEKKYSVCTKCPWTNRCTCNYMHNSSTDTHTIILSTTWFFALLQATDP